MSLSGAPTGEVKKRKTSPSISACSKYWRPSGSCVSRVMRPACAVRMMVQSSVANPTACDGGCLILRIALNPARNHRAGIVAELWVRPLRTDFKSEMEHWHVKGPVSSRPGGRRTKNVPACRARVACRHNGGGQPGNSRRCIKVCDVFREIPSGRVGRTS